MNQNAKFIEVSAGVRYWEDARVNGVEDKNGSLIPFRDGDLWKPFIRLSDGLVENWPENTQAYIHYKVCDAGQYWLCDENKERIAKWTGDYVPNSFLCHGDKGYGDYIIFTVETTGKINGWIQPIIEQDDWQIIGG